MRYKIQTFTDTSEYKCATFYGTSFNNCVVIIKEVKSVDEEWLIEFSMSVPTDFLGLFKAENGWVTFVGSLGAVALADEIFHAN